MSEVSRYWVNSDGYLYPCSPAWEPEDDELVKWPDFKRLQDERDALQVRLSAADQRIDELERGVKAPLDPPQPFTEQFLEDHLGKMPAAQRDEP